MPDKCGRYMEGSMSHFVCQRQFNITYCKEKWSFIEVQCVCHRKVEPAYYSNNIILTSYRIFWYATVVAPVAQPLESLTVSQTSPAGPWSDPQSERFFRTPVCQAVMVSQSLQTLQTKLDPSKSGEGCYQLTSHIPYAYDRRVRNEYGFLYFLIP